MHIAYMQHRQTSSSATGLCSRAPEEASLRKQINRNRCSWFNCDCSNRMTVQQYRGMINDGDHSSRLSAYVYFLFQLSYFARLLICKFSLVFKCHWSEIFRPHIHIYYCTYYLCIDFGGGGRSEMSETKRQQLSKSGNTTWPQCNRLPTLLSVTEGWFQ